MMKTTDVRTSGRTAVPVPASPATPSPAHASVARAPRLDALAERASQDALGPLLARAVSERALAIAPPASRGGGAVLARTILDKRSPAAAWKAATSSTFAGRRGRNQPTLLVVDELLSRWGEPGVAQTLRFTLKRWLATYTGSRAPAARALLAELGDGGVESIAGPEVEAQPARAARPAAKYATFGMMVSGLTKDLHNPLAYAGSDGRSLQYRAAEHSRQYITTVENGLLMQGGRPLDTGRAFIFVMDGNGTIYSASKGEVTHHSSFISGQPAAAAGSFVATAGQLTSYNGESGHYQPTVEMLAQFKAELESRGVSFEGVKLTTKPLTEAQQAKGRIKQNAFHRLGGLHSVDDFGLVPEGHKGGARPARAAHP
jgi:hypothetical protein